MCPLCEIKLHLTAHAIDLHSRTSQELVTDGKEYTHRIQGSLMADAVCSILASLFTSMPNTTFSQNNGVIAMTKCASRRAGLATGFWLILMGVLAKIAGIITSIPDCGKCFKQVEQSILLTHLYCLSDRSSLLQNQLHQCLVE